MRLFFHKLGLLFSSVLSVLLLSVPTTPIVDNIDNNIIKDDNAIEEKVITENEVIESNQEELQKETKIEKQEIVEEKKENDTSTNSNKSITNNVIKETNVNTKQETNTTSSASSNVEVHEESQKQEINNNVNQYIGVPNPNDFYYSFHHGKIEYSSMDSCLADVPNIAFKDTTDIINTWCIDVVDGQGTILGQYLYINCSSGNCDKYK
ncbi:MAG: hypothetical protein ACI310_00490 [Bacilli bacterium]